MYIHTQDTHALYEEAIEYLELLVHLKGCTLCDWYYRFMECIDTYILICLFEKVCARQCSVVYWVHLGRNFLKLYEGMMLTL